MTIEKLLDLVGEFTWDFGTHFFIETSEGNFIWSDPEYSGDNTICPFNGTCKDWYREFNIPFGRDKGSHIIRDYCGPDILLVE